MVVKGMDETPVLPESEQQLSNKHGDSQIQSFSLRALNASTSSPGISTESSEDPSHLAGHTGPIHYEKRTVFSPMNQGREVHKLVELGLTERRYPSFIPEGQSDWHKDIPIAKDAHLLRSGELGMCNDPYCRTCPIYYRKVASQRTSSTSKHPFHHSLYRNAARGWATRFSSCIGHHIPGVLNPHAKFVQHWNKFFFMSCLIAVFVDPLFFFLQSVKLNEMCVAYNLPMTITVVILRTMTDVIFLLHILLQFRLAYVDPQSGVFGARYLVDESKKIALNYLHGHFSVDLFTALPLPQIMILLVLPQIPQSIVGDTMKNLSLTAVLAPRIFKFLPLLAGRSPTGFIFESAWVNFVINLLTFVLSGHVIGSCWYLFGLQRVTRCLRQACNTTASCMDVGCINYSKLSKPLPENWKMNVNASYCFQEDDFYYGIYRSAVNLTTQERVVTRYMYSLFWGFQQISTLAGNLIPGYFLWEIVFTMAIIGLGLFLFALLIGNMQNFLQSLGRRRLEMSIRSHDADQWMSRMRIPEELKRRVFEAERYNWAMTEGINQEKILENLPEDLQIDIRRHLFKFLQKVRIFELLDDPVLDAIYGKLRQRTFITGSKILNRDGIIERIIFIVRGRLQSVGEEGISDLSEGDVCGEELLEWCLHNYLRNKGGKRFKVPMMHSSRSVKCLTNVEAFTLELADLEELTMRFARLLRSPRVVKALRSASPYLKSYVVTPTEGARREKRKCITRRRTPVTIASLQWRR